MTKNPISWVTGDIQLPLLHVLTSYVALSNTRYTPGIHVAWTLGNQHDGKALPGRRSCCRRRSMVPCISGRNKSLACCFCWPPSSDVVTDFRCPSVTIECRTYWRFQAFYWVFYTPGTYKGRWPSSSYPFLEFHPQRVRRGYTTGAFLTSFHRQSGGSLS